MHLRSFKSIAILFIAIAPTYASAKQDIQWQGTVVYVTDGDTLWVQPNHPASADSAPRKIRLEGIDAPESCQAYGRQSTSALKQLIAKQVVTVTTRRLDDYGREVAKITLKNTDKNIDVGAWMVSHGHAWSYHYRHSAGPYAAQEQTAQSARLGLFADTAPVQPSIFRKTHGSCHVPNGSNGSNSFSALRHRTQRN